MKHIRVLRTQLLLLFVVLCLSLMPVAMQLQAQTPESMDPPASSETVVEPPAPDPPAENPPADNPPPANPPVENPPAEEPPAENPPAEEPPAEEPPAENPPAEQPPVENPPAEDPTEGETQETPTSEATYEASTPESESTKKADASGTPTTTPTEEVVVPDQLNVVGAADISIVPGAHTDVVVRYTLGSDREKTELSANLTAPGGESLEDWTLIPWQRVDLDEDPADANRHLKARFDQVENLENGDVIETIWRITAPDHIEKPVTVRFHTSSKIHREDGVTDGVIKNDFVTINSTASVHTPTFVCDPVVAEDVENTWNCTFDTTHPDDDVAITASADVPEGWELTIDGVELTTESTALSAEASAANGFTLSATYPIGCPDLNATFSSTVSLAMTYPSGEVADLQVNLPLVFERPNLQLEVTSFEFGQIDDMESLVTTGTLELSYSDAPCAWQGVLQLSDLTSDEYSVDSVDFTVMNVETSAGGSVTISDNSLNVLMPAATDDAAAGTITIELQLELPHLIPPGLYVVKLITQTAWMDEI